MGKSGKMIVWSISLLLLILAMGCSLKIDIDPDRSGREKPSRSERTR